MYLNPRPQRGELGKIYPSRYHSYAMRKRGFRHRAARRRLARLRQYLPPRYRTGNMLDVGCGNGWQLDILKRLYEGYATWGIEIDKIACEQARLGGHHVANVTFEAQPPMALPAFDLIAMTHVLEHLPDPKAAVERAASYLRPGGILVIETPNVGAWEYRLLHKRLWGAYHIPRHWYFFDRASLSRLGVGAGLTEVAWYCHPGPTHWVWTLHNLSLEHRGGWPVFLEWLCDPVAIFQGKLRSTLMLALFWCVDRAALTLGRETSVMTAVFRKPT